MAMHLRPRPRFRKRLHQQNMAMPISPRPERRLDVDMVRWALERSIQMLEHDDLSESTTKRIQEGSELCRRYIQSPRSLTRKQFNKLGPYVLMAKTLPADCHDETVRLSQYLFTALRFAQEVATHPDLAALDEYCDLMHILGDAMRCQICFGDEPHNTIHPEKGRPLDWSEIAEILTRCCPELGSLPRKNSNKLPGGQSCSNLPDHPHRPGVIDRTRKASAFEKEIVQSIKQAAASLSCEFEDVAWQILKYSIPHDSPGRPRQFLRNGSWDQLAQHTHSTRLIPYEFLATMCSDITAEVRRQPGSWRLLRRALDWMDNILCRVQNQWFEYIRRSSDGSHLIYGLTNSAFEVNYRLVSPDSLPLRNGRPEPLYNFAVMPDFWFVDEERDFTGKRLDAAPDAALARARELEDSDAEVIAPDNSDPDDK